MCNPHGNHKENNFRIFIKEAIRESKCNTIGHQQDGGLGSFMSSFPRENIKQQHKDQSNFWKSAKKLLQPSECLNKEKAENGVAC